jgi:DNA-binding response OmpR family regulator
MPPMNANDSQGSGSSLKGLLVLVVEDTWHVARALTSALTEMGMIVVGPTATTAEAERLATDRHPDLAVVDVNLKGEMAYGLIDWLHERGVRVIIVTGYAVLPRAADKAAAILQKPFSGAELRATLCQVMAGVYPSSGTHLRNRPRST